MGGSSSASNSPPPPSASVPASHPLHGPLARATINNEMVKGVATSLVAVLPDGSIGMKWPWWRGVRGTLKIEGRRLDGKARPIRADIPSEYGLSGFQPSGIYFSTEGCWEVTGRVGEVSLTFVTLILKASSYGLELKRE
jgi:hypothetical protein